DPGPYSLSSADGVSFVDFGRTSSVLFQVVRDSVPIAMFKPMQSVEHSNYRGEIASYRLCTLLDCNLEMPANHEVFLDAGQLVDLTGVADFDAFRDIERRNSHMVFYEDDDRVWLYGSMEDWVPDFTRLPIEYDDVWEDLVDIGVDADELHARSLAEQLAPLRDRQRGYYDDILARTDDTSVWTLAWSLSDMHVFDELVNNHDRFLPDDERYGMNCHWRGGRILSLDNGATFRTHAEEHNGEAFRHLRSVQVFSRRLIDEVRWMDTDALFLILFPPSAYHDDDLERYSDFLERRDRLLEYVDDLVEDYGEEAVYVFP
ncbi:MAG: hypothetical protein KDA28_16050, partial [Phycisphaerales bacterium]|nr:hypothetical protein [Phycisphaerales bacterium]